MKVSDRKELATAEFSKINIEFTEDDELIQLVQDNTNTRMGGATTTVIRCLTLIAGGSSLATARKLTGITARTLTRWRSQEWYSRCIGIIQDRLDAQLDGKMTSLINKGIDRLDRRLDEGDAVVQKDGTLAFKPVTAKDAAIITSIFFDKRNLLRNKPTSISTKVSTDERLDRLADRFREMAIDAEFEEVVLDEQGEQTAAYISAEQSSGRELDAGVRKGNKAKDKAEDTSKWAFSDS